MWSFTYETFFSFSLWSLWIKRMLVWVETFELLMHTQVFTHSNCCWPAVIRSRELSHPEVQNVGIALDHSIARSHWYDIHIDIKSSANFGLYILICYMTWASASLMLLHSIPDKRWMEVKHCWVWMVKDDELKQRVRTVPSEWWKSPQVQRERPVKMWQ